MNFLRSTRRLPFRIEDILNQWAQKTNHRLQRFTVLNVMKRPFSVVFKIHLQFESEKPYNIYLKFYSHYAKLDSDSSLVKRDFDTTHFWFEQFKESKKYHVIEPLYYDDKQFILITKESEGRSIHNELSNFTRYFTGHKGMDNLLHHMELAGEWLRYFQSLPLEDDSQLLTFKYIADYISYRLDRIILNKKVDFDEKLKDAILDYLKEQWQKVDLEDRKLTYVHTDFSLSNVLVKDSNITVLDFNKNEIGSPYKDLTRFYHQIHLFSHKPVYKKGFIEQLKSAFLKGYGNEAIATHPLFKIYFMIHVINHFGKTARYWEHSFVENLYNRLIVRNTLKKLHSIAGDL